MGDRSRLTHQASLTSALELNSKKTRPGVDRKKTTQLQQAQRAECGDARRCARSGADGMTLRDTVESVDWSDESPGLTDMKFRYFLQVIPAGR